MTARSRLKGFSLLELIMVIAIVSILAGAGVYPILEKSKRHAREAALIHTLHGIRQVLNNYVADKRKLPDTLDDLVNAGYFKEIPVDPITGFHTWNPELGRLPGTNTFSQSGIKNVHSLSEDTALDGSLYNTW